MRFLQIYGRVMRLLARDRGIAAGLVVANLAVAGLQAVDPLLFGRVIQMLARADTTDPDALWWEAARLLGVWAAVGACGILANIAASLRAERLAHRHRLLAMQRFYEHVLALPASFHGAAHSGRLMKVMLSGADAMFGLWLSFFRDQLATFLTVVVLLPMTLLLNWRLALALIALAALFCLSMALVIRRTEAGQARAQDWQIQLAGTAQDAIANVTLVQSFSRLSAETRLFGEMMDHVIRHQFPVLTWWALVNVLTRAASTVTVIAIVVLGTVLHLRGEASVGEIVSFMGMATLLIGRLDGATAFCARLFFELPGLAAYFEVMDTQSPVRDAPAAMWLGRVAGEVAFEHVSFAYPSAGPVLRNVSLVARPGTVVALVGPTGAGKSTAIALLQRLWDPDAGRILIDGQDLRHVAQESLRANIAVVFQESLLFNRSIRDNLMIGRPDASQAELEAACRQAEAHDFIQRQPQGYDTMIGERGVSLSGGQRQRLAIARALLKNPPILILDEATSALDAATEARVTQALRALMAGRTTFVIAHRLSTVREADEILVLSDGAIVERGSFVALLAAEGLFADLVATQLTTAG